MATTTTLSTINTTGPTVTTNHNEARQNTTLVHTPITTTANKPSTKHIFKTRRQHTTITIAIPSTSPPLCTPLKTSLPTTPSQPSTTTSKPKTTSSKRRISPSEHLPFTFYFIPNRPNYISKLNLIMNLARLCT